MGRANHLLAGRVCATIVRTSLFQCRGRAPDKSTVKRRFRAISVTMRCCNTNEWRQCGALATFALIAERFPPTSLPSAVFAWRESHMRQPHDFSNRVCHTCQSGGSQSSSGIGSSSHGSMTSWPRSKMPDTATDSSTG